MTPHLCGIGLAMCTPHPAVPGPAGPRLSPITVEWHRARQNLAYPTNFNIVQLFLDKMEVGEARQEAVRTVMEMDRRPDFLFFLDQDVLPAWDGLNKLLFRAAHYPDYDIFAGVYCLKSPNPEPLIYKGWGNGPFWDWTIGDLLLDGITGVHMGMTLIRTSLFDRLDWKSKPAFLTEDEHFVKNGAVHRNRGTEDLFFCKRAVEEVDAKILVDTSVLCGHQDISTGIIYGLPKEAKCVKMAEWLSGESPSLKRALDIGAGSYRREWEGHRTYTTDIRPDTNPDYVQDTRYLNLPDEHFDLLASSHHLEHLPRWEQEAVWKQMFRLTKPGGRCEHIVPSLEWAAQKIVDGDVDQPTINVLYGAQESHQYARDLNTHYFGYTKAIGKALAESAGYVDVTCEDWRDNPDLGLNLVIRGRKPIGQDAVAVPPAEEPVGANANDSAL